MKMRSAVIANDPIAEEAAQDFMMSGGSAVGAVLCLLRAWTVPAGTG